ncbi:MAG: hypothetical protein IBX60_04105 [Candidatus Aminicenantes bacterium]|nr:hypothetical protein [Candidatus Aminicenantes bacterium]
MWFFNSIFGKIFEFIFIPFSKMNPWIGMAVASFLTGIFMLAIFRWTSNQEGIRNVKNKIKAHLLEIRLYKDNLSLSLKAQGNILRYNLKYVGYSAKPMVFMIIPIVLIIIQLNFWFGYESLSKGQNFILKVKLKQGYNPLHTNIVLKPSSGIIIETPPLRIEEEGEIDWRLAVAEEGSSNLQILVNGQSAIKTLTVSQNSICRISPIKVQHNIFQEILYPGEPPIKKDIPIQSIEIKYPQKRMNLFGWHIHWIIAYFILSIIFGFAFKGFLKVEI